jgi:formylglycine-generating enzyme required for sulfatase activity
MSNCNPALVPVEAFETIAGLRMIPIPAGNFMMGSPPEEKWHNVDEGPQHEVTLEGFWLGQTPITQAQWRVVAGWPKVERELDKDPSRFKGDDRPVERVSWHDAMEFCHRLSERLGRTFTLPSEAQWEYACRASTTAPFHFGETITPKLANYDGTYTYANGPKGEYRGQPIPVGTFPANAWGLHDMHGNVWEWCLDHWHESYEGAPTDGSAWVNHKRDESRNSRLLRGGSWYGSPRRCRSAVRSHDRPSYTDEFVGFRVVCLPEVNYVLADQQLRANNRLPIDEAPRDGRVCLIGGPRSSQAPEYRAWAWFNKDQNAWCEVGFNGITYHYHAVKWYYPDPFGIQPATE